MSTSGGRMLHDHDERVAQISRTIKDYYANGQKYRINHGSTNSTRTAKKGTNFVDLSALNRVLHVDKANRTALVEPNVPMDRLIEATLPHGLVPPVVMEFPGITAGGGYAGTSGESSSFRHGFFDRTLDWAEIVLANGDVVRASETEHSDLFRGAAGAVGSIGTTTLVQLRLKEAKPYVEATYHPVNSMAEAVELTQKLVQDPTIDYVDGIMYSLKQGAVVTGRSVSTPSPSAPIQRFSAAWDPFFYLHVQSRITQSPSEPVTETLPIAEYLFRYDRGGFWVAPMAFQYFHVPFTRLTRWFLDDFLHTRMMYTALHSGGAGKDIIIQDLALPMDTAAEFVDYTASEFKIWPLWLCPLRTSPGPAFHPHVKAPSSTTEPTATTEMMMNIGLWGWAPLSPSSSSTQSAKKSAYLSVNRSLESTLARLGGMKWLYAKTFYTETEFWRDHVGGGAEGKAWYDALRSKYHATGLPSVWEKTHTDIDAEWDRRTAWKGRLLDVWPLGGLYGLWKAIRSGTYRTARASLWRGFERTLRWEERKKNV